MRGHVLAASSVAGLALAAGLLAQSATASAAAAAVAPASIAPAHTARSSEGRAAKTCTSPSSTGTKKSKYNTTPKGGGPWQVPLDPCNTEAAGSGGKVPYFNCAYWAAEKRPDVWVNAVWKDGYPQAPHGAWNIEIDARKAGYSINHKPKAGDLVAWPDNATMGKSKADITYFASAGGHVAYVERVHRHGAITISTMGQAQPGATSFTGGITITIKFDKAKSFFIHHHRS
jgi:surface antigen